MHRNPNMHTVTLTYFDTDIKYHYTTLHQCLRPSKFFHTFLTHFSHFTETPHDPLEFDVVIECSIW